MFIHLWFAFRPFRDSTIPFSSSPLLSISVSDLSQLCEGKGFSVGDGCLKSEENDTHTDTCTNTRRHTYSQINTHTSSVRQRCDGQHWHLAGGTIRWWRRVGARKRVTRWIEREGMMVRGRREGNVKDHWPSVCFCGYLPLHCLLAENEAMC